MADCYPTVPLAAAGEAPTAVCVWIFGTPNAPDADSITVTAGLAPDRSACRVAIVTFVDGQRTRVPPVDLPAAAALTGVPLADLVLATAAGGAAHPLVVALLAALPSGHGAVIRAALDTDS